MQCSHSSWHDCATTYLHRKSTKKQNKNVNFQRPECAECSETKLNPHKNNQGEGESISCKALHVFATDGCFLIIILWAGCSGGLFCHYCGVESLWTWRIIVPSQHAEEGCRDWIRQTLFTFGASKLGVSPASLLNHLELAESVTVQPVFNFHR